MKIFLVISLLLNCTLIKADDLEKQITETVDSLSSSIDLKENFFTNLIEDNTKKIIDKYLKENPFSQMSESQVKALVEGMLNNKILGRWLAKNPKVLNFLVRWLHDKEALPSFLNILNKPDKMKTYSYIALALFILSFIFNLFNSKGGFFKRVIYKLCIFLSVTGLNIIAFLFIFRIELYPTFQIVKSIFF